MELERQYRQVLYLTVALFSIDLETEVIYLLICVNYV
jgi:hypothetical protein